MNRIHTAIVTSLVMAWCSVPSQAVNITTLDPIDAVYDGGKVLNLFVVNPNHAAGLTFNITFTPTAADLGGLTVLMAIGGEFNGTGLYLINGVPVFIEKHGSDHLNGPGPFDDVTVTGNGNIAVDYSGGSLTAGVETTIAAMYDPANEIGRAHV